MSHLYDSERQLQQTHLAEKRQRLSFSESDVARLGDARKSVSDCDIKSSTRLSSYSCLHHLPTDWLAACFDFLMLQDLLALVATSAALHAAIGRMTMPPTLALPTLSLTNMQRIIRSTLSSRIEHLTVLVHDFSTLLSGQVRFPPNLRTLQLIADKQAQITHGSMPHQRATSNHLKQLCLESSEVELHRVFPKSLTILTISGFHLELPQHIDVLRSLPRLTSLRVLTSLSVETFTYLLRSPFILPLKNLDLTHTEFSDAHAAALQTPIALEQFTPWAIRTSSVSFLHMLPVLHTLHLPWRFDKAPSAASILSALCTRTSITELFLSNVVDLNGDHVAQFLTLLPELRNLSIQHAPNFRTFDCFSLPGPHHEKLERVAFSYWGGLAPVPSDEVEHLWRLHAIRRVELVGVCEMSWEQYDKFWRRFNHGGKYFYFKDWKRE